MTEASDNQESDGRESAASGLYAQRFPNEPRPSALGSSGLKWLAGLVGLGALLWGFVVIRDSGGSPPRSAVSLLSPQSQALEVAMPQGGRGRKLSVAEIRWCLREDIRIETLQTRLTTNTETERFNDLVNSYNHRCTHFEYRDDDLAQARRDIDDARSLIVAEVWAESGTPASGASADLSGGAYSVLTKDVQELLRALAYAAGPADGHFGARTKTAIESFEKDQGRAASGRVSEALRKELLDRVRNVNASEGHLFNATPAERAVIRESCASCEASNALAAYNRCVEARLQRLARQGHRTAAQSVSEPEMAAIDETCAGTKLLKGPDAYDRCVEQQIADLGQLESKPSFAGVADGDRTAIEDSCTGTKFFYGPAAFYRCAQARLAELSEFGSRPDLTLVSAADQSTIESSCAGTKRNSGPAAYYRCVEQLVAVPR